MTPAAAAARSWTISTRTITSGYARIEICWKAKGFVVSVVVGVVMENLHLVPRHQTSVDAMFIHQVLTHEGRGRVTSTFPIPSAC